MIPRRLVLLTLVAVTVDGRAAAPSPADPATAIERVLKVTVMLEGNGVYGAGILVDPASGTILTSNHVVSDMKAPRAATRDGRRAAAKVIAVDEKLDLALLSAPELADPETPAPAFADPTVLAAGDALYAAGMPRKLPFSLSRGIVAYPAREMDGVPHLQLDMNINEGNSGGPVFTDGGEIVAVMSFIMRRAQGLAFAVPVTDARAAFPKQWRPAVR